METRYFWFIQTFRIQASKRQKLINELFELGGDEAITSEVVSNVLDGEEDTNEKESEGEEMELEDDAGMCALLFDFST